MQYVAMVWMALDFWMLAVFAIFILFCYVLRRLDLAQDNEFKFHDFFTHGNWDHKADLTKLGYFAAFITHSLIVLHQEMKAGVTTEAITLYALVWSGAYVATKFVEGRAVSTEVKEKPNEPNQQ